MICLDQKDLILKKQKNEQGNLTNKIKTKQNRIKKGLRKEKNGLSERLEEPAKKMRLVSNLKL